MDLYFVASLGGLAIAGVGLAGNLMMVILGVTQTLGVGTSSLIAQTARWSWREECCCACPMKT